MTRECKTWLYRLGLQRHHLRLQRHHLGLQHRHLGLQHRHLRLQHRHLVLQRHLGLQRRLLGLQHRHRPHHHLHTWLQHERKGWPHNQMCRPPRHQKRKPLKLAYEMTDAELNASVKLDVDSFFKKLKTEREAKRNSEKPYLLLRPEDLRQRVEAQQKKGVKLRKNHHLYRTMIAL